MIMESSGIGIVGVVGSGTMGNGIAQAFAQAGYLVHLSDVRQDLLDRGMKTIEKSLERFVQKGTITVQDRNAAISRISPAVGLGEFAACGLVVEAVNENLAVKTAVFQELDRLCAPGDDPGQQYFLDLHHQAGGRDQARRIGSSACTS